MSTLISSIPVYDPTKAPSQASNSVTSAQDLSQNFLQMLTAQLRNQDPLNPMDNAAMTSQLASLNTVDGINKLNTSVNAMVAQMQSANFMNLSGSVGKTALAAGNSIYYAGQAVSLAAKLDVSTSSLKAVIRDANGQIVDQYDLGSASAGTADFIWDGTDSSGATVRQGAYSLELSATDAQGNVSTPQAYVGAMVASIGQDGTDLRVGLSDGRSILTTDILKWLAI